jgi:predicted nucleotide-binding protein
MASRKSSGECADRLRTVAPPKPANQQRTKGAANSRTKSTPPEQPPAPGNNNEASALTATTKSLEGIDGQFTAVIESTRLEIRQAKSEILRTIQGEREPRATDITDPDLREVVELLEKNTGQLAKEATVQSHVQLRLDDLFLAVGVMTSRAMKIDAIDLEIHRWADDPRGVEYGERNLKALEHGAWIRRVYVISPKVDLAMIDKIQELLIEHLEFNDVKSVKDTKGHLEIRVIHYRDLPGTGAPQDFAIFEQLGDENEPRHDKVLYEKFKLDWTSTFVGQLSKEDAVVAKHKTYFDRVWKKATLVTSIEHVTAWAGDIRNKIAVGDFELDLFIGYCNAVNTAAAEIVRIVENKNYTVMDWKKDFDSSASLINEIERARKQCALGFFLFTKDDLRVEGDPTPRDNVVFECGYFWGAKGQNNVLVILEDGAKPPADIKGVLWQPLPDRDDVNTIRADLIDWLEARLGQRSRKR